MPKHFDKWTRHCYSLSHNTQSQHTLPPPRRYFRGIGRRIDRPRAYSREGCSNTDSGQKWSQRKWCHSRHSKLCRRNCHFEGRSCSHLGSLQLFRSSLREQWNFQIHPCLKWRDHLNGDLDKNQNKNEEKWKKKRLNKKIVSYQVFIQI